MGYAFSLEQPHDGMSVDCAFNVDQMSYLRVIMIEAGVIAGDGFAPGALIYPELATCADTLPARKFSSNDGWHITAPEAGFIAARLRLAMELDVVSDVMSCFDDGPDRGDVYGWMEEFTALNETAAQKDGYYVR